MHIIHFALSFRKNLLGSKHKANVSFLPFFFFFFCPTSLYPSPAFSISIFSKTPSWVSLFLFCSPSDLQKQNRTLNLPFYPCLGWYSVCHAFSCAFPSCDFWIVHALCLCPFANFWVVPVGGCDLWHHCCPVRRGPRREVEVWDHNTRQSRTRCWPRTEPRVLLPLRHRGDP